MSEFAPQLQPEISIELQDQLHAKIREWMPEVRALLSDVDAEVSFDNRWLIEDTGTGGFALEPKLVSLAFNPDFSGDKTEQMRNFKGSLFHELYHTVQGFVGSNEGLQGINALENAIYEGAATMFEVLRAGTHPGYSQYPEDVEDWVKEVASLGVLNIDEDMWKWKFFDPDTERRWVLYRTGYYIVDQALQKSDLSIEDLVHMHPLEIFALSGIKIQ